MGKAVDTDIRQEVAELEFGICFTALFVQECLGEWWL